MKKYTEYFIIIFILIFAAIGLNYIYVLLQNAGELSIHLKNVLVYTISFSLIISLIITIILIIAPVKSELKQLVISFIIGSVFVIVINSLLYNSSLSTIDGSIPKNDVTVFNYIEIISCIIVPIVFALKYKFFLKHKNFIILMIVVMQVYLIVPGLQAYFSKDINSKNSAEFKPFIDKDIWKLSKNNNVIVLVLDSLSDNKIDEMIKDKKYSNILKDYIRFNNYSSCYPYTDTSGISFLGGKAYDTSKPFNVFRDELLASNANLEVYLKDKNWIIKHYGTTFPYYFSPTLQYNVAGVNIENVYKNDISRINQLVKIRLVPSFFKYKIYGQSVILLNEYSGDNIERYEIKDKRWDMWLYNTLDDLPMDNTSENNVFWFVHLKGAHAPWIINSKMQEVENREENMLGQIKASFNIVDKLHKKLKENGIYDNTMIIITADHGYGNVFERANPILLIKGYNYNQENMHTNNNILSQNEIGNQIKKYIDSMGKYDVDKFENNDIKRIYYINTHNDFEGYFGEVKKYKVPKDVKKIEEYKHIDTIYPPLKKLGECSIDLTDVEKIKKDKHRYANFEFTNEGIVSISSYPRTHINLEMEGKYDKYKITLSMKKKNIKNDSNIVVNGKVINISLSDNFQDYDFIINGNSYNHISFPDANVIINKIDIEREQYSYGLYRKNIQGGKNIELSLPLSKKINKKEDLDLSIYGSAYFDDLGNEQNISIYFNGKLMNSYNVSPINNKYLYDIIIPKKYIKDNNKLEIKSSYEALTKSNQSISFILKNISIGKGNNNGQIQKEDYFLYGWSYDEKNHRWSVGNESILIIPVDNNGKDVIVNMNLRPYLNAKINKQKIKFMVDNLLLNDIEMDTGFKTYQIKIPKQYIYDGVAKLTLKLENPVSSPSEVGSGDRRYLGVDLRDLTFDVIK